MYLSNMSSTTKEEYLLTDSLEPTNEWYAIAKSLVLRLVNQ